MTDRGSQNGTVQPHYNVPHYSAVFNITRSCHGSRNDCFVSLLHGSLITRSFFMDPKDSVIMRLTCTYINDHRIGEVCNH